MEFEKENEEFDKEIQNAFIAENSDEGFLHIAEVQRNISETMRKIRILSDQQNNSQEEAESVQIELINLTNEYLSLVKLENQLIAHCQTLLNQEKEAIERQKDFMVSLNSKRFAKIAAEYLSSTITLEDEPYSENCGNIRKSKCEFVPGSFACLRKKKDDFILVMIAYPTEDNKWVVYDAAPTDGTIITYTAKPEFLFPMTTSLPSALGTDLELKVGDKVLSLWREDETSVWTTQFYYGVIVQNPDKRGKGYTILFDEDQSEEKIPEQFVISKDAF